jgi:site-specific DNA recombinase
VYDLFSSYERRKIIERSKRGKAHAVRSGKVLVGPSVPLGYDVVSGKLVINQEESELVKRIYHLCVDWQMGTWRIAKLLSTERIPTKTDRLPPSPNRNRKLQPPGIWSPSSIQRVLRNHLYKSLWHYGRRESCEPQHPRTPPNLKRPKRSARLRDKQQWITVSVPCIIPDELWQAAQTILDTNKYRNPRRRRNEYLFINHSAICGNCGRPLTGFMSRGKRYYRCASQSYNITTWWRGRIRADSFEEDIWAVIRWNILEDPTYLRALLGKQADHTEQARTQLLRDQELYGQQLTVLDREAAQWERAYAGEAISQERFKALLADIENRRALTRGRLQEIEALLSHQQTGQGQITYALEFLDTLPDDPLGLPEKRRILEALHLVVVVRNLQQGQQGIPRVRLFFELPMHEHIEGDVYAWRGPETWKTIAWSEDLTPTISISGI